MCNSSPIKIAVPPDWYGRAQNIRLIELAKGNTKGVMTGPLTSHSHIHTSPELLAVMWNVYIGSNQIASITNYNDRPPDAFGRIPTSSSLEWDLRTDIWMGNLRDPKYPGHESYYGPFILEMEDE